MTVTTNEVDITFLLTIFATSHTLYEHHMQKAKELEKRNKPILNSQEQ